MERTEWSRALSESGERLRTTLLLDEDALGEDLRDLDVLLNGFADAVAGGLYQDVLDEAPRLEGALHRITAEQHRLRCEVGLQLRALSAGAPVSDIARREMTDLSRRVGCMASRALQLVHDAYDVDIGGPPG